ncbi:MAG TPA: cytochrome c3 family protein [Xanthobacteraceae bacterium]|nr:cytochrome c3 family protein [Xanthobacteraceae bacterium]
MPIVLAAFIALAAPLVPPATAQSASAPGSGHGYLIDKHLAAKLACAACHAESPPQTAPPMATCLGCHGGSYEKLAQASASHDPNPHASHQGPVPCATCHHVHSASQNFCNSCHNFDMTTP